MVLECHGRKTESMTTDELLFRYLNQETSNRENRKIREWLSSHPDNAIRLQNLEKVFTTSAENSVGDQAAESWLTIEPKMLSKQGRVRTLPAFTLALIRVAAILLVLAGSGILWLNQSNTHVIRNRETYTKSFSLPDGTQVDLGPGSKMVYGKEFLEGTRVLRLSGEAYFNVTSDPAHPFTVIAGLAKIKVTGTQFVVNANRVAEEVEVSVKSGIVLFYNSDTMDKNSFRMGLVAGEKGIFYPAMNRMDKTIDPYFRSTP